MQELAHTVDPKIVELIEQTVRESMEPFGLRAVHVRAGEDHAGDPVIFVEADYDLVDLPIDVSVTAKLTHILRDRLWKHGETRFPHIRHKFDERHKVSRPRRAKV
ncbi:MAG TPA: hypothetical protein VJ233_15780 [Hyphomicrobiaceae bacterium]|nr:hypothetical protein [Hyphomicrobiaceae bacterium]